MRIEIIPEEWPVFIHVFVYYINRIEKEKTQLKGEIEDLHAQIEHVSKNRVNVGIIRRVV